ncbi:putative maltase-glucoamylase 2, partial [Brachionus plicatilis]
FYLTPFPSLSFRAMGGILDTYIFLGPSPAQAIEQFQQTFGLPKLPPYWALGAQFAVKQFLNDEHVSLFINNLKMSKIGFDSIFVGVEHMNNGTMFTINQNFLGLNRIAEQLKMEGRAMVLQLLAAVGNNTQNYPFSEGISTERYWILENFFSSGVVGKLLGRHVLYPDFTMEKTQEWWKDAFQRFFVTNNQVKFDGIFFDYLTPFDENMNKTCPNNKWNYPPFKFDFMSEPIYNATICMDSRYEISKHYNIHGMYSHYVIESTAK